MKKKLKKAILKRLLTSEQLKKIKAPNVNFPGGILPINDTMLNDVFIVGFPKSGNTLMQHIIAHLYYGLNDEGSRSMINLIAPDIYANPYYFRFNDICFFKSHERPQPQYKKVIYLLRDGREALLSYYHMVKNMGNDISLKDLYSGKIAIYGGQWFEHIEAWEKNPFNSEILFIKYEDLKQDKLKELEKLCVFLNIKRTKDELNKVIELTSLEHMKKLELKTDWKKMKTNVSFKGSFVRKGELDSFKTEVPNELVKFFENSNSTMLNKYY